jgi:hypothetical protein
VKRLLRPTTLILLSAAVALGIAALAFWPGWEGTAANRAIPRPVPAGDQEIAWLYYATQAEQWERLVNGIRELASNRPELGLDIVDDANVFPTQSTEVAELAVTIGKNKHRLWFRWYKLTSDQNTHDWVDALTRRQPPPLAIIGGGSSDRAQDLATELEAVCNRLAAPPLMAITSATADEVEVESDELVPVVVGGQVLQERKHERWDLMKLYPERSFRFCFTNTQMARAVTYFIWSQPELRPDTDPAYIPIWKDAPYSRDLADRFVDVLRLRSVLAGTRTWAWQAGCRPAGTFPIELAEGFRCEFPLVSRFTQVDIPHSIGTINQPNRWEAEAADKLLDELDSQRPVQRRALLALPAPAVQPARRFLHALLRAAPGQADRFVVAMGDSFDFNTVYRDRNVIWPIQELPFSLVFFCHRNPVDPVAFQPEQPSRKAAVPDPAGRSSTGTDYLILYRDTAETLARAAYWGGSLVGDADQLRHNLRAARIKDGRLQFEGDGRPLFDSKGNRPSISGEYVVWLEPVRGEDQRVLPRAHLRIFRADSSTGQFWQRVPIAGQLDLLVEYRAGTEPLAMAAEGAVP